MNRWLLPFLLCLASILGLPGLAGCNNAVDNTVASAVGVLEGKVSIVSQSLDGIDQPYPPEVYQPRKIVVYNIDRTVFIRQVDIDEYGYYRVELSPGTYVIDINYFQYDTSDVVPRKLNIEAGKAYMFDIGFDTELVTSMPEGTALVHAQPYRVIGESKYNYQGDNRTVGLWYITSPEASGFEEYAQTAAQAALDFYNLYHRTFTSVLLVPREGILTNYAQANFAADGKGAEGLTGDAPAKLGYWVVWASDRVLTEQELSIAEMWSAKQEDFPAKNSFSSLSYDSDALRQYIAKALNIPFEEVQMPFRQLRQYKLSQTFIDKTISLAAVGLPNNPKTELAFNHFQVSGVLLTLIWLSLIV